MPIYCYRLSDGGIFEGQFPFGEAPEYIDINGTTAFRCLRAEIAGQIATVKGSDNPVSGRKGWPLECVASGVHAEQAVELREHLRKSGVPTDVTSDGDPIYTSAAHRKKALKARGMHDRNSFS